MTGVQTCALPIFNTGVEHYTLPLEVNVGGERLVLAYDTARRAPTTVVGADLVNTDPPSFGELWRSSLHRRLVIGAAKKGARVSRGDGSSASFIGDGAGAYTPDPDINDRIVSINGGYRFTDAATKAQETYNTQGQLTRIDRSDGQILQFTYGTGSTPTSIAPAPGYLLSVQDSFGRTVQFEYELPGGGDAATGGRVKRITDAGGRVITPIYTGANLSQINWPDTQMRRFHYENASLTWAMTGVTDENGARHATIGYDSAGRATSSSLSAGVNAYSISYTQPPVIVTSDVYDAANSLVLRTRSWQAPNAASVTRPNGTTTTLAASLVHGMSRMTSQSQPAGSGCSASTSAQTYDANGNLASKDDFNGNRTCYVSDQNRNLETVRVEGLAGGAACTSVTGPGAPVPAGSRKTSTQWHPNWRLATRTAEPGRITTSVYNGQPDPYAGNAIASCAPGTALLPDGQRTAVLCRQVEQATTDTDGSLGFAAAVQTDVAAREQRWTYNEFGQVLTHDGPRTDVADVTTYQYYTDTAFSGTDPYAVGHTKGDLWRMTNAAGHVTQYTQYNKHGQLLEMIDPNGVLTTHTYDLRQRLTSTSVASQTTVFDYWPTGLIKRVTQPDASYVHYDHDDEHRLVKVSDSLGNSITYTLDNMGNRVAEETKDPAQTLRRQLSRSFDALGRVQQVTASE